MPLTPEPDAPATSERTTTVVVGAVDDIGEGEMKMVKVGERRVAVIRTASGIHAIDNACPHQGYGLVTGALDDELVTCQWHNWKFRVDTGECVMGEEDVPCHAVTIEDGTIHVTVDEPTAAEERERLWPSLRRGVEDSYVGQVARDSIRLLANDAAPEAIAWVGFEHALPREEWGIGHAMATAVDCLAWTVERDGDDRALPLVQALAALAEPTRGRPARQRREPRAGDLLEAIEGEDHDAAMGIARRLAAEADPEEVRRRFIEAASMHHLSYGHGIIYTQKAFELLDLVGWDKADLVLHELALATTWGTREDTLPYMRKAVAEVAALDLGALATTPVDPEWNDPQLVDVLLDLDDAPIAAAVAAPRGRCRCRATARCGHDCRESPPASLRPRHRVRSRRELRLARHHARTHDSSSGTVGLARASLTGHDSPSTLGGVALPRHVTGRTASRGPARARNRRDAGRHHRPHPAR